jgi:sugar phosphate isomerase/epimerase
MDVDGARVGTDSSKFPLAVGGDAFVTLERAKGQGLDGVFFRSIFELSPCLDLGEVSEIGQAAADLGLYLEAGVGKVNPFAIPENPEIRRAGDGDYLAGMTRAIAAAAAAGIHELWAATANYQFGIEGIFACDRFRTDTTWDDQLNATAGLLTRLAPIIADHSSHINIETHEEITSGEVVRLVEQAGPDVFGITFDCANVVVRGEDPVSAAERVAPYVRQTHLRDVVVVPTPEGLSRFIVPVGEGIIDWDRMLRPLLDAKPDLTLSVEGIDGGRAEMTLYLNDDRWLQAYPDLSPSELERVVGYGQQFDGDVTALRRSVDFASQAQFITASARALRTHLHALIPSA